MKSLRLVNIRSFSSSNPVSIEPLTLLVGQNSSGKSTFARTFPLLRQTSEVLAREPLLWLGRLVDFGSAEEAASRYNSQDPFGIDFEFKIDRYALAFPSRGILRRKPVQEQPTSVRVSIRYLREDGLPNAFMLTLKFFSHEVSLTIKESVVTKLVINKSDYTQDIQENLFASTWSSCFPNLTYKIEMDSSEEPRAFVKQIYQYARRNTHGRTQANRVAELTTSLTSGPLDQLIGVAKTSYAGDLTWKRLTSQWKESTPAFKQIRDWVIGARIAQIVQVTASEFREALIKTA